MYSIYIIKSGKTPFYVGMSKEPKRRFKTHLWESKTLRRNLPVNNKIRKLLRLGKKITFAIVESGISEADIDGREKYWVAEYRKSHRLCNLTDGGRPDVPKAARKAAKKVNTGSKRSLESRKRMSQARLGMKFTKEHKKNLSIARKKRIITKKTRLKTSKTSTGRINIKKFILTDPSGIEYTTTNGLTQFCKQHGLCAGNFSKVLNGERLHQKGWKIKRCKM